MTKAKIFLLTHSLQGGGAEMAMKNLTMYLGSEYDFRRMGVFKLSFTEEGKRASTRFSFLEIRRRWIKIKSFLEAGIRFRREIISFEPDLLVINCEAAEVIYAIFGLSTKSVVIVHVSKQGYWKNHKFAKTLIQLIYKFRKPEWRFVSRGLAQEYGLTPESVLPNICNYQSLISGNTFSEQNRTRMIFVGRLHPQKQPEKVLELSKMTGVQSVFVGSGPQRSKLEELARELNVNAKFLGYSENVWELVTERDILVLTSDYEGKPLVIDEAVYAGLRVVALELPYLVNEYQGLPVFFAKDLSTMSKKIIQVLESPALTNEEVMRHRKILNSRNQDAVSSWRGYFQNLLG